MVRKFAWTAAVALAAVPSLAFSPTSSAQPTDPAFRPCDWVTVAETSAILGKLVFPTPSDEQVGSNNPRCFYAVEGLGRNAVCVYEPNVTPPSTTIVVLLDGGRVFRSTAAYEFCDTVERFARTAITRLPA
jgi:hypothetical protein